MRKALGVFLAIFVLVSASSLAKDPGDSTKKSDGLSQPSLDLKKLDAAGTGRLDTIEKQAGASAESADQAQNNWTSWIELSGDFRSRFDSLRGDSVDAMVFNPQSGVDLVRGDRYKNNALLTNRFGLNLKIQATEDVQVKARLLMYKVWGHETAGPVTGANAFFADKQSIFDGNIGHTPSDNALRVDTAYATWSNIGGQPIWFSIGRRPSTGGVPTNLRMNREKTGTAGTPGLLIDYAFDGLSVGAAANIESLPGFYLKFCYGKGYDSGFESTANTMKDVNFVGLNVTPYETEHLRAEFQYSRGMDIFAFPEGSSFAVPAFDASFPNVNLGDIDQFGVNLLGRVDNVGPGTLNVFASPAMSKTHPNGNTFGPGYGLLWDEMSGESARTGYAVYLGARYDLTSKGTKLGVEYNHGSKDWITFTPASDDMWTSKLGTRGNVYEAYLIKEIGSAAVSKLGKAFFRIGYQYYDFNYTGSNNWVGAPVKTSDLGSASYMPLMFVPLKNAHDFYATFEVQF
jgi:hypothetical protein